MKFFPHSNSTFSYTCRVCGFKFTSTKNPHKILLSSSSMKITEHQVEAPKLNIICPKCKSSNVIIDFGKIYNFDDGEEVKNNIDFTIPVTIKQKISVSIFGKVIDILSFAVGKITKADKVKKNNIE